MATLEERLTAQLETWLSIGSGGFLEWPYPVRPEPPFSPFSGFSLRSPAAPDEGVRERFLAGIFQAACGANEFHAADSATEFELHSETELPEPTAVRSPVSLTLLPPTFEAISNDSFLCFLLSIRSPYGPVTFELRGDSNSSSIGLHIDERDVCGILQSLDAFLPGVDMITSPDSEVTDKDPITTSRAIAELGLDKWFPIPFATSSESVLLFHTELFGILDSLHDEASVSIQIQFEPCRYDWRESTVELLSFSTRSPSFSDLQKKLLAAGRSKLDRPLFATSIRIVASDSDPVRSRENLDRVLRAVSRLNGMNSLSLASVSFDPSSDELEEATNHQFRRSGMLLSLDELAAVATIPGNKVHSSKLQRRTRITAPAPLSPAHDDGLVLGSNCHRERRQLVTLQTSDRTRHIHVIGASGSGKSTFLLNCVLQDLSNGQGLAVLDPHGDLVDAVLDRIPEERANDVVLVDPADSEYPLGFNILGAHSEIEKNLLASDFVAIFERLSSSWGDQMTAVLGNAALAFLESDRGGTLLDLRRFLVERGFRSGFLKSVRDPEIVYFWEHEFPLLRGNTMASLVTRINGFLRQKLVRNMVSQKGENFDVAQLMNQGKIILAPLAQGLIGEENSWLLGSLLVSKFYQSALARQSLAQEERRPFWLYLDEAHRFLTPSLASILSGARKYGLGLVLAHQELNQFARGDASILSSILANSFTRICFRLGDDDAKRLASGFSHFTPQDFTQLPVGSAIARIGGGNSDFNLDCPTPQGAAQDHQLVRRMAIENSRRTFATPRTDLERSAESDSNETRSEISTREQSKTLSEPEQNSGNAHQGPPQAESTKQAPTKSNDVTPKPGNEQPCDEPVSIDPEEPKTEEVPLLPGRGGLRHKELQAAVKAKANALGFGAEIDAGLPNVHGFSDVLVQGEGHLIAFEVALQSGLDQELKNVTKSFEAGCSQVVILSEDHHHLTQVRDFLQKKAPDLHFDRIHFIQPDDLDTFFAELVASSTTGKSQSRGYTVSTRSATSNSDKTKERSKAIHRAIAEMRRKRKS